MAKRHVLLDMGAITDNLTGWEEEMKRVASGIILSYFQKKGKEFNKQ